MFSYILYILYIQHWAQKFRRGAKGSAKDKFNPVHHDIGTLQGSMPLRQAEVGPAAHP